MHSLITALIVFTPIFAAYRKKAIPYFLALISHLLIGDYLTGGSQLLWPATTQLYGIGLRITGQTNTILEWTAFIASIAVMIKFKDINRLLQHSKFNIILAIPTFTVLLPALLAFPLLVPLWLIPPHLFYVILFSASMAMTLIKRLTQPSAKN